MISLHFPCTIHYSDILFLEIFCLQTSFPLGFNDKIYHEGNISKMPDFDVFQFWNVRNVKEDLMVNEKTAKLRETSVLKTHKYFS